VIEFVNEGCCARVHPHDLFGTADLIRWAAPLGLAAQGPILLHMSAVRTRDGVAGFMGGGGAGKSTLAQCLAERGLPMVSDDMVVCDDHAMIHTEAEPLLRRWCQNAASTPEHVDYTDLARTLETDTVVPLTLLFVLTARRSIGRIDIQPTGCIDALVEIANHRLGTHPSPLAWKNQFQVFTAIAQHVPVARLSTPEGIDRLRAALPAFERYILGDQPTSVRVRRESFV
jgi:hypothetical protein